MAAKLKWSIIGVVLTVLQFGLGFGAFPINFVRKALTIITFDNYLMSIALTQQKGQMFLGMLAFCMSFFEFESAACSKKRHAKNEHPLNHLALLILPGL